MYQNNPKQGGWIENEEKPKITVKPQTQSVGMRTQFLNNNDKEQKEEIAEEMKEKIKIGQEINNNRP